MKSSLKSLSCDISRNTVSFEMFIFCLAVCNVIPVMYFDCYQDYRQVSLLRKTVKRKHTCWLRRTASHRTNESQRRNCSTLRLDNHCHCRLQRTENQNDYSLTFKLKQALQLIGDLSQTCSLVSHPTLTR